MTASVLMVQGCTSDAGKSTLVAALCRWAYRRGMSVAPFKPQNMALNSAVTVDGGEIGRAQAVQAQAAGLLPHTDFNPILLKPNSDIGAQVIVHGHPVANMDARHYHDYKRIAMDAVLASHHRLADQYDAVIVEGAGSPAEINLRDRDIANMGYAEAVDCPVILIADIDRGGVFAHLVGTLALLSESERARVAGFVINRFRGDMALLQPGLDWLERETGKPVLGVLPYLHGLQLEAEDALPREATAQASRAPARVGAGVAAHQQSHRLRCVERPCGGRLSFRRPGRNPSARRSDRLAWVQIDPRRPRLAARPGLERNHHTASTLRGESDRHLRRLPDAGAVRA